MEHACQNVGVGVCICLHFVIDTPKYYFYDVERVNISSTKP
jgi:hypothetical protein